MTDSVQEFADGENAEFESVYVLASFDSPDYSYLYERDNRIVGPPVILHCAAKEEVGTNFLESLVKQLFHVFPTFFWTTFYLFIFFFYIFRANI